MESVKVLPKALDPAVVYFYRATAYYYKGEKERAILDYNQALKLNPNLAYVYKNRGITYIANGEYDRAVLDFNQALKLNPNYAEAYGGR